MTACFLRGCTCCPPGAHTTGGAPPPSKIAKQRPKAAFESALALKRRLDAEERRQPARTSEPEDDSGR